MIKFIIVYLIKSIDTQQNDNIEQNIATAVINIYKVLIRIVTTGEAQKIL